MIAAARLVRSDRKIEAARLVSERIAKEEDAFIELVRAARRLYGLTGKGDPAYGRKLIMFTQEGLPGWFKKMVERRGLKVEEIDEYEISVIKAAFNGFEESVRAEIAMETGISDV